MESKFPKNYTYFFSQKHCEYWKEEIARKSQVNDADENKKLLYEENIRLCAKTEKRLCAEIEKRLCAKTEELQRKLTKLQNAQILIQDKHTDEIVKPLRGRQTLKKGVCLSGEHEKNAITKIVFEGFLPEETTDAWDVSELQNGSIKAWIDSESVLHIGANGIIGANADSSALFKDYVNVTNIDFGQFFDTSSVNNMNLMFVGCRSLKSLDVSRFDTSRVISMAGMFLHCHSLEVDIHNFDMKNVKILIGIDIGCKKVIWGENMWKKKFT